jgi:hypothetical protein
MERRANTYVGDTRGKIVASAGKKRWLSVSSTFPLGLSLHDEYKKETLNCLGLEALFRELCHQAHNLASWKKAR